MNTEMLMPIDEMLTAAYAEGRADQLEEDSAKMADLKMQLEALHRAFGAQYQADAIASANSGTDQLNVRF